MTEKQRRDAFEDLSQRLISALDDWHDSLDVGVELAIVKRLVQHPDYGLLGLRTFLARQLDTLIDDMLEETRRRPGIVRVIRGTKKHEP